MQKAGDEFSKVLDSVNFKNPEKRIFSNVTGKEITSGEEAKKLAVQHFTNPVRWTSEEKEIAALIGWEETDLSSKWRIIEAGPGSVLSGLWRDSGFAQNINCKAVNCVEHMEEI